MLIFRLDEAVLQSLLNNHPQIHISDKNVDIDHIISFVHFYYQEYYHGKTRCADCAGRTRKKKEHELWKRQDTELRPTMNEALLCKWFTDQPEQEEETRHIKIAGNAACVFRRPAPPYPLCLRAETQFVAKPD